MDARNTASVEISSDPSAPKKVSSELIRLGIDVAAAAAAGGIMYRYGDHLRENHWWSSFLICGIFAGAIFRAGDDIINLRRAV